MIKIFLDESGTDADEMTIAGYVFLSENLEYFESEWEICLEKWNIPFFHMVDCAHGAKPFSKLTKFQKVECQKDFFRIVKRFSVFGIVAHIKNDLENKGSSYAKAIERAYGIFREWQALDGYSGSVDFIFEAGAEGRDIVEQFLDSERNNVDDGSRNFLSYRFVSKAGNPGVQAADIMAWQYQKYAKDRIGSLIARLDMRSLMRYPHIVSDSCGEVPRPSKIITLRDRKKYQETIFYLPPSSESEAGSTLLPDGDFTVLRSDTFGIHLACSNCKRVLAEDMSIDEINCKMRTDGFIKIVCHCRAISKIPSITVPYLSARRDQGWNKLKNFDWL